MSGSHVNDVVYLNIGGQTIMAVQRQILTSVEDSMLASIFSDRWVDSVAKDKDGNYLIDFPSDLVVPMIDYLRLKMIEKPEHTIHSPSVYDFGGCTKKYEKFSMLDGILWHDPWSLPNKNKAACRSMHPLCSPNMESILVSYLYK
jgi:hypothetical protein